MDPEQQQAVGISILATTRMIDHIRQHGLIVEGDETFAELETCIMHLHRGGMTCSL